MCGRFILPEIDLVGIANDSYKERVKEANLINGYEAKPGETLPIIALNKSRMISSFLVKWGYSFDKKLIINARSETVYNKPLFKDGIRNRRCIIPISKYIEWRMFDKTKEEIKPEDFDISYLAGIYRIVNGTPEFTVLTKEASDSVRSVHDRMPIIFTKDLALEFLKPNCDVDLIVSSSLNNMVYEPQK